MTFLHITQAKYLDGFRIRLQFNDGSGGVVDLSDSLDGTIFRPLKDKRVFQTFTLEGHTLTWPNGADFAPEYLQSLLPIEKVT